jgi:hypothetical protein
MSKLPPTDAGLDDLMERASVALARMDYLTCEDLCLEALGRAQERCDWAYFARIVLPLQEARRQRRLHAADGVIALGVTLDAAAAVTCGCVLLGPPATLADAVQRRRAARQAHHHVEVLFADNPTPGSTPGSISASAPGSALWTLRGCRLESGQEITVQIPAPPLHLVGKLLGAETADPAALKPRRAAADWFMEAADALGRAALEQVGAAAGSLQRLAELQDALSVFDDHEILHQRLADAARALTRLGPSETDSS